MTEIEQNRHFFKLIFDGKDLVERINEYKFTRLEVAMTEHSHVPLQEFQKIEEFAQFCFSNREEYREKIETYIPFNLAEKYEVGYYNLSMNFDFSNKHILLSSKEFGEDWASLGVTKLEFIVTVSRDATGAINNLGLRCLNQELVYDAFKWIFPCGQSATFGLHTFVPNADGMILVEGFRDYVAFRESGHHNVVGLGSVSITDLHREYLPNDIDIKFCYDQDWYGNQKRKNDLKVLFVPYEHKDPWEAFLAEGKVDYILVK